MSMQNETTQELAKKANAAALYVVNTLEHGSDHELNTLDKVFDKYPALLAAKQNYVEFPDLDGFCVLRKYFKDNPAACDDVLESFVTLSVQDLVDRLTSFQKTTMVSVTPANTVVQSATVNTSGSTVVQVVGHGVRL